MSQKESDTQAPATEEAVLPALAFSPMRTWVIAQNTFTQLVRMKTFYFLVVFVVLVLAIVAVGLLWDPYKHLLEIKRWSFGAMSVFAMIYAIASTSLLLPRDLEDRTLYTILSKPVPRFEYLMGRVLGVILVMGASMLAMYLLMSVMVAWKTPQVEEQFVNRLIMQSQGEAIPLQDKIAEEQKARQLGVTFSLFWGFWALFLKGCVMVAVTLFISTFASSSLFTIVMSSMVLFIGHFHQMALNFWLNEMGGGFVTELLSRLVLIIFPNYGIFDVLDPIISGTVFPFGEAVKLTGLGLFYVAFFTLLAQLIFVDKEL